MSSRFPKVGVIGAGPLARAIAAPAAALGVDLLLFAADSKDSGAQIARHVVGDCTNLREVLAFAQECDVVTFEDDLIPLSIIKGLEAAGNRVYPSSSALIYSQDKSVMCEKLKHFPLSDSSLTPDSQLAVMVARSPHGQAASWTPIEIVNEDGKCAFTIVPAQNISASMSEQAQQIALEVAQAVAVVGVMTVKMSIKADRLIIDDLVMRPHIFGNWSIEGSVTSQFEQHLRAILDLPLGNPDMNHKFVVTGDVIGGDKEDMYRPYLHLMARNPSLHFHQYKNVFVLGGVTGHLTACGDDLPYLREEIEHARDYMSGVIDE